MKKRIALLLAMTMAATAFTGCGNSTNTQSGTTSEPQSTPVSNDVWPAIGSKDAPVTVKVLVKDVLPTEEDVIALCDVVEKKMAGHGQYIDLQFVEPPAGSYATALPLAMRTGDVDADIVYFQGGGDLPIAQEGLLEDLTPYIQSSTYVKDLMLPVNQSRLKNYPYLLWLAPARTYVPVMKKELTTKLSSYDALVKDPTIDNYHALFTEMKTKGLVKYAITADDSNNAGEGNMRRLNAFFNQAFGVSSTLVKEDGRWVFSRATEAEKKKLEFYASLYKEGLLDSEYLTNTWDVLEQKFYEGKAGIISGTVGDVIQIYNNKMSSTTGSDLVVLPPAKGVAQGFQAVDVTKEERGFALNAESKNKNAAWAFLEFMASPEGRIIDKCGIEGKHYKVENEKIVFTDKYPEWWSRIWVTTNKFEPNPPLARPVYTDAAQSSLDLANQYYVEDVNVLIPEELAPQWDAMKSLYDEYSADIIRGTKPISAFDEFVIKWNKAGGDKFAEYLKTKLR